MRSLRLFALSVVALGVTACASGGASSSSASVGGSAGRATDAAVIASAIDVANAPFVGSRKSKKYYPSACHTVKLIKTADRVGFGSQKDAETAGFGKDVYSTDCQY